MKKIAFLAVLICIAALAFAGGGRQSGGSGQVTINLWHIYVEETDTQRIVIDEYIKQYEASHPNVKIEQHVLQDAAYKDKMLVEFSGRADSIDVFSYWGAGRAGDIYNAGKLLCVQDYMTPAQLASIKPGADNNFKYNGKLYGMPRSSWMMILYCNTELFQRYGVKLPETYAEWLDACKKFDAAGIIPIALGGGVDDAWQAAFVYEALVNRLVGVADETKVLNSMSGFESNPKFREAAEKMIEMSNALSFGKSPLEIDEATSNAQFLSGAAAMRLTGSWFTKEIYESEDSVIEGKVVALAIPMVPGGNGKATDYVGGIIDGFFVNAATKYPEIATDFTYGLSLISGNRLHEIGDGFTAFNLPVNEGGLYPLAREVAVIANKSVDGFVAWDTFLPGDLADIHLDACQTLLTRNADINRFMTAYRAIFK